MNVWLWCALALVAALVPLVAVAATRSALHGLVALEVAGVNATFVMLLIAEGTHEQSFVDLALVLGVLSFASAIAYLRFLDRAS